MSVGSGLSSHILSQGQRFYAYSGVVQGDVSVPASITLISFTNGLRDSFVKVQPFYGAEVATGSGSQLGIIISIDGVEVWKSQQLGGSLNYDRSETIELFLPRQSTIEVVSRNTSSNNTQDRGATLLGWYL